MLCCKYFLPFWGLSFGRVYGFLCCAKVFKFKQAPFVYFCFYFHYSRKWVKEYLATVYGLLISLVLFQLPQLYNVLQFISMKGIFVTILLKPCMRNSVCCFCLWKKSQLSLGFWFSMFFPLKILQTHLHFLRFYTCNEDWGKLKLFPFQVNFYIL